jgi:hypothetical protein
MDARYYRISVACDIKGKHKGDMRTIWICFPVTYTSVIHSTWPSRAMWRTHAPTFNKSHKKNKQKKVALHMLTYGAMWGCGLNSWIVCINDKICDIRERNVTTRSDIWTTNICSLGFRDVREWVTLWGLVLQCLGCRSWRTWKTNQITPTYLPYLRNPWQKLLYKEKKRDNKEWDLNYKHWFPRVSWC